eukprot:g32801.t1
METLFNFGCLLLVKSKVGKWLLTLLKRFLGVKDASKICQESLERQKKETLFALADRLELGFARDKKKAEMKLAKQMNGPEFMWVMLTQTKLADRVIEVFAELLEELSREYEEVKQTILSAYKLKGTWKKDVVKEAKPVGLFKIVKEIPREIEELQESAQPSHRLESKIVPDLCKDFTHVAKIYS